MTESDGLNYTTILYCLSIYTWPTAAKAEEGAENATAAIRAPVHCSTSTILSLPLSSDFAASLLVRLARSSHPKTPPASLPSSPTPPHTNGDAAASAYSTTPRAARLSESPQEHPHATPAARLRGAWRRRGWTRSWRSSPTTASPARPPRSVTTSLRAPPPGTKVTTLH